MSGFKIHCLFENASCIELPTLMKVGYKMHAVYKYAGSVWKRVRKFISIFTSTLWASPFEISHHSWHTCVTQAAHFGISFARRQIRAPEHTQQLAINQLAHTQQEEELASSLLLLHLSYSVQLEIMNYSFAPKGLRAGCCGSPIEGPDCWDGWRHATQEYASAPRARPLSTRLTWSITNWYCPH